MSAKKILYLLLTLMSISWAVIAQAASTLDSIKPFPPFRIANNLYYVGNDYQASYLIVTSKGNILINSDFEANVPRIKASIEKLGFKFNDTKILLISHAHGDHSGGSALIKSLTGAKYMVMDADVAVVESGGKADFHYGTSTDPENFYPATKVDRVLHDGDQVKLGNAVLVAHHTGGHTKECTTWSMKVTDKNKVYNAVIVGGPYVNPGYNLVNNATYPEITQDYKHTFQLLKSLPCDIFLGAHGGYYDLKNKYALMNKTNNNRFVDPKGYKKFITLKEKDFQDELLKQKRNAS